MYIRPYRGTDETKFLALWNATMTHDRISKDLFRLKVLLDPNFAAENLPVAIEEERMVGFVLALTRQVPLFAQGLEPDHVWITAFGVHPTYQRRGIGTALFNHLMERFKYAERRVLDISPYVPNTFVPGIDVDVYPAAITFLQDRLGFRITERANSMDINLTGFQIPQDILALEHRREREDGITIHPVTSADLPDLIPFIAQHFGSECRYHTNSCLLEYFGDSAQQVGFLVARRQGEVVGFCQQRREQVGPLGVHPDYRRLQIGRLLLFRCLEMMSAQHIYYAYIPWVSDDMVRLFDLAGFQQRRSFAILRKEL